MNQKNDEAKANIIKGVNKKLRRRGVVIAAVAAVVVAAVGVVGYYLLFVRQVPIGAEDFVAGMTGSGCVENEETGVVEKLPCTNARGEVVAGSGEDLAMGDFQGVQAYTRLETINQLDDRALHYNHVVLPMPSKLWGSLEENWHTHVENYDDGTAALYFYMSENVVQSTGAWSDGTSTIDILFGYHLCDTCEEGAVLGEITRIYYLVYDYDNFVGDDFEAARSGAVLLWEKK